MLYSFILAFTAVLSAVFFVLGLCLGLAVAGAGFMLLDAIVTSGVQRWRQRRKPGAESESIQQ